MSEGKKLKAEWMKDQAFALADPAPWDLGTFEQSVPKYKGGVEIKYTVEEDEVADYGTEYAGDAENGFTITNTYGMTPLKVTKVWDDNDDAAGMRPDTLDVTLKRDDDDKFSETVTLDADQKWTYTWYVPKDDAKVYTVAEDTVPTGYYWSGTPEGSAEDGFTITNLWTGIGGGDEGHLTVKKEITSPPANGSTYALYETIEYKITVISDGEDTVTDITVTDELTGLVEEIASLAPGESKEFKTAYTVTEDDILAGEVLNVATAEGTGTDPKDPTEQYEGEKEHA